jgi:hypothetical protein
MMFARRTKTYASGALIDTDGVLESVATSATAQDIDGEDLDGAALGDDGYLDLPRTLTVTLSSSAGSYSTDPIVVRGKRGAEDVVAEFEPPTADGDVTLRHPQAFDRVISIHIPEQVDTSGAITVGVENICAPAGDRFAGVELAATGNLHVQYGEQDGSHTDVIAVPAALVGYVKMIAPSRIITNPAASSPTAVGITLYLT